MNQSASDVVTYRQMVTWITGAMGGATAVASIVMGVCTTLVIHALDNYPTLREIDARFATVTEQSVSIKQQVTTINQRITELRQDLVSGRVGAVGETTIDGENTQYVVVFLEPPPTGEELKDQRIREILTMRKQLRETTHAGTP